MTYQLTKKQDFFQKNIENFVRQHIAPRAAETDRRREFPHEVVQSMGANRLLGLVVPKEDGGEGAAFFDLCLVLEGIAKTCPTAALLCSVQNLGSRLLSTRGKPSQKEQYLADLMAGRAVFGYALPDVLAMEPTDSALAGARQGEGFVVNGKACFIVNGDVADLICLFAGEETSVRGFLAKGETPGLRGEPPAGLGGAEARCACKAVVRDCPLPSSDTMGDNGTATEILAELCAQAACFNAARAVGIAQGAVDYAVRYSKEREQFGRPIGRFQAVQAMLADMSVRVEAARHLVYKTAAVLDEAGSTSRRMASMAKYFAAKTAGEVTRDAVQVGGGYGYTRDYPLEKMMRNAGLCQVLDGSAHAHQLAIAQAL